MAGTKGQQVNTAAALKTYCQKHIEHIKEQKDAHKEKHQKRKCITITPVSPISGESVPVQIFSTLRLKTVREEMRKCAEQDFHESSNCKACMAKQADLAMNLFIRTKRNQLQAQQLERIHSHTYNQDTVCLLGELLKDMPKASHNPCEIWQRLLSTEQKDIT